MGDREGPERVDCGAWLGHLELLRQDRAYRERFLRNEAFISRFAVEHYDAAFRLAPAVIPVVVHIVYNTPEQNLPDSAVHVQIDALNRDFSKSNADVSNAPPPYLPLAADAGIQFQLAVRDPNCNPTSGITRHSTTTTEFDIFRTDSDVKSSATGGADPWPNDKYLNIWVCPVLPSQGGYGTFPGAPAPWDGVAINYEIFGPGGGSYAQGRTTVHEVGHYFSLYHPFYAPEGCTYDDLVSDTPTHADANYYCPTYPHVSCPAYPNGDMFMQYMDYTNDACRVMFTSGQVTRMQAALSGPRASLLASDGLVPPPASPGVPDLWSADTPYDDGTEPDPLPAPMWQSEDIWVRNQNDGITVQDHQNPVYRAAGPPNYVYVRVRNRGCGAAGSGNVKLYWAKASAGLSWPQPWDGTVIAPGSTPHPASSSFTGSVAAAGTDSKTVTVTAPGPLTADLDWTTTTAAIPATPHSVGALGTDDVPFTVSANGTVTLTITWPAALPNPIVFLSLLDADAGNAVLQSANVPTGNSQTLSFTVAGLAPGAVRHFIARAQNNSPTATSYTHASSYPVTANVRLEIVDPTSTVVASDATPSKPKSVSYTVPSTGTGVYTIRIVSLDWATTYTLGVTYQTAESMGGPIGTQPTGSIAAGGFVVLEFPWSPPNPDDYASFGGDQNHFCLLSRIETSSTAPFGMTTPETSNLSDNVRNNNNIVWKNVEVVTLSGGEVTGTGGGAETMGFVTVGHFEKEPRKLYLAVQAARRDAAVDREENLKQVPRVRLALGEELQKRLAAAVKESQVAKLEDDGRVLLEQLGTPLGPIELKPVEHHTIGVSLADVVPGATTERGVYLIDFTLSDDEGVIGGQRLAFKVVPTPAKRPLPLPIGQWWHSHEEDDGSGQVFRREGFDFPPSPGRRGVELRPDGTATVTEIAPAGGVERHEAAWHPTDTDQVRLLLARPDRPDDVLEVHGDDDSLVVKR